MPETRGWYSTQLLYSRPQPSTSPSPAPSASAATPSTRSRTWGSSRHTVSVLSLWICWRCGSWGLMIICEVKRWWCSEAEHLGRGHGCGYTGTEISSFSSWVLPKQRVLFRFFSSFFFFFKKRVLLSWIVSLNKTDACNMIFLGNPWTACFEAVAVHSTLCKSLMWPMGSRGAKACTTRG